MSFKKFLTEQERNVALEKEDMIMGAIIDFFSSSEKPTDKEVHELAEQLGIDEHELEEKIYELLSDFFNAGEYKRNPPEEIDEEELKKGIKVEMKHTDSEAIARKIALDNIAKMSDYYTKLEKIQG